MRGACSDLFLLSAGQQGAGQTQHQPHPTEGQQLQWDSHQPNVSGGEQQAVESHTQSDLPFGQPQGHLGGYGQAAFDQGPVSTAAAPEHSWEPQPAGVLNAPAWPAEVCPLDPAGLPCRLATSQALAFQILFGAG